MKKALNLEIVQKIATPVLVGIAVAAGTIVGVAQINQRSVRRKQWFLPTTIIVAIILAGFVGAVVEHVVAAQPHLQCLNGSYAGNDGTLTCRAVLATSIPVGATARCNDDTYSFNHNSSSLCSRHGGVQVQL